MTEQVPSPEAVRLRALNVANAEVAECLRDLCFAANMPASEHRNMKVAGCLEGIERAVRRIESSVLCQSVTKLSTAGERIAALETELAEARKALLAREPKTDDEEYDALLDSQRKDAE